MKHAMILTAMAGLSTVVSAQSLSVNLTFDATDAAVGETVTAMVTATFTGQPAGAYLSSINVDLIASSSGVYEIVGQPSAVAWNNPGLGFDGQGTASGSDILGLEASQFSLIPPVTAGSPILITTFTLIRVGEGSISYTAQAANNAPFLFSVTGGGFADPVVAYGSESFFSATLNATPTPGALGVLGVCGLAAAHRRRSV